MSGASDRTRRVTYVNGNWSAGDGDRPAAFELLVVTEDEVRHTVPVPDGQMAALVALTQASSVLLWDPEGRALIAANLVGEWLPTSTSLLEPDPDPSDPADDEADEADGQ